MKVEADSPCARAAREYIDRGLAVIPLGEGKKTPATKHGINDWSDNPGQVDVWWGINRWFNVGIVTGQPSGGVIVIDLDVHDADHDGTKTLSEWEAYHGKLPETWEQVTGSGGRQLFYRVGHKVKNSTNGALGVDIRGDGGFVVAPPSVHPNGESYEWRVSPDDADIADATDAVLEFIEHVRPSTSAGEGGVAAKPLFELPEAIESDRNNTLFKYASSLREKGLDGASIAVLVEDANSKRCRPPLPSREVRKICGSVLRYAPGNEMRKDEPEGGRSDGDSELQKAKRLKNSTSLEVCRMMLDDPDISSGIKYDEIDRRPWKVAPLPWSRDPEPRPITDGDIASMYGIMEYGRGIRSMAQFRTAFEQYQMMPEQRFNPIDDVLAELPRVEIEWGDDLRPPATCRVDGEERMTFSGKLFNLLLEAQGTEYTTEVELLMLRQLVARALHPGCKADSMIVLAGAQGIGKSTFSRELALHERFFLDGMSKFDEEHKRRLIGKLVVEVSELEAFNYSDMSSIKQAITAQRDNIRMPYREYAEDFPRTCIFIGTTNESAFLTDTTGNRRFLPVVCGQKACKPSEWLFDGTGREMIRQAVAETVALHDALGAEGFLKTLVLPQRIMAQVVEMQEEYTQEDDVLVAVSSWLDSLPLTVTRVNVKMAMIEGMDYSREAFSREKPYIKNDVARALSRCDGWEKMKGKQLVNGFGTSQAWRRST